MKEYSIEELECIRQQMEKFIFFVKEHNQKPLPRCFHFCNLIIKNIDISEANAWDGREELSEYISQDWKAAMEIHAGLPEYYILCKTNFETKKINKEIYDYIVKLDKLISKL